MNQESVQISHEELLVSLALLGLPAPLALGPRPAAGYLPAELGGALAAALGGLAARGLATLPHASELPALVEPLASLVGRIALAERCMVITERRAGRRALASISGEGGSLVLHTSPAPRLHRLTPLGDAEAGLDWLLELIQPRSPAVLPALEVAAEQLAAALDALSVGQLDNAVAALSAGGVPTESARTLLFTLGPEHVRLAIGVVTALRSEQPAAVGAFLLGGQSAVWWAETATPAVPLRLRALTPAELRNRLSGMVRRLVA